MEQLFGKRHIFSDLDCTINLKRFRTVKKPVPLPLRLNVTSLHEWGMSKCTEPTLLGACRGRAMHRQQATPNGKLGTFSATCSLDGISHHPLGCICVRTVQRQPPGMLNLISTALVGLMRHIYLKAGSRGVAWGNELALLWGWGGGGGAHHPGSQTFCPTASEWQPLNSFAQAQPVLLQTQHSQPRGQSELEKEGKAAMSSVV